MLESFMLSYGSTQPNRRHIGDRTSNQAGGSCLLPLKEATRRDKVLRKANTTKIHFTCSREPKLNPNAHSIDKATDDCDLISLFSRSLMDSKTSIDKPTKWKQAINNERYEHQHPHEMAIEHCKYQTDRCDTDSLDVYLT
jgi:hypothetical protein